MFRSIMKNMCFISDMNYNLNPFYQGHTIKDLVDPSLGYWVHHGRHILPQGRTIWWNPRAEMMVTLIDIDIGIILGR